MKLLDEANTLVHSSRLDVTMVERKLVRSV
jgi:hypothetical protein